MIRADRRPDDWTEVIFEGVAELLKHRDDPRRRRSRVSMSLVTLSYTISSKSTIIHFLL